MEGLAYLVAVYIIFLSPFCASFQLQPLKHDRMFDRYSASTAATRARRLVTSVTTVGSSCVINIPPPPSPPPAPETILREYKDNALDKVMIYGLSYFLAQKSPRPQQSRQMVFFGMDFKDFVTLTKSFMWDTKPMELRRRIVNLLNTVVHPLVRHLFQFLYRHFPKWFCEMCSFFMSLNLMTWLVGPSERFVLEVDAADAPASQMRPGELFGSGEVAKEDDHTERWHSGVKLVECRYFMESGCKANCLHLCKGPTQQFFAEELGIPLYMKPNFEDFSCELQFGVAAPAQEDDPAYKEKCFSDCTASKSKGQLTC